MSFHDRSLKSTRNITRRNSVCLNACVQKECKKQKKHSQNKFEQNLDIAASLRTKSIIRTVSHSLFRNEYLNRPALRNQLEKKMKEFDVNVDVFFNAKYPNSVCLLKQTSNEEQIKERLQIVEQAYIRLKEYSKAWTDEYFEVIIPSIQYNVSLLSPLNFYPKSDFTFILFDVADGLSLYVQNLKSVLYDSLILLRFTENMLNCRLINNK